MNACKSLSPAEYYAILREDFYSFLVRSFYELNPEGTLIPGRYIDLLSSKLQRFRDRKRKRVIVNQPPRTLKSLAASVALPAWLLGHDPSMQIICASYGQDLADKLARDCRTLMTSDFYRRTFPNTVISVLKNSVNDFMTTAQGFRMATSVNGVLTGRGADLLVLDDILKPDDALSETRRRTANEWFFNTLLSRVNNKAEGQILIVMQRLHQEDLVGEVTAREPWDILALPAIAQQDEKYLMESPFGNSFFTRKAGEALHPERDSVETYSGIRDTIGDYHFQSQYQQSPVSLQGGLIKRDWLKFYDPEEKPERFSYVLQSWDTANKNSDVNDYSVCTTWGIHEEHFYLLDVFRKRLNYPTLKRAAADLFAKFKPNKLLIEDKSSGTSLIQEFKSAGAYRIEPYLPEPGSDKFYRTAAQSIKFENGRVLLPWQAPWLDEYVREITGFPGTKFDDQVDSTSQALEFLTSKARSLEVWRKFGGN